MRYDPKVRQFGLFLSEISASDLDFSRDGKWVTYITIPEGDLWRSRVDGSERLQVTYGPAHAASPRWSPDGSQIVYIASQFGRVWKLFLVPAQGGAPEELMSENKDEADPTWSSDGTQIAFGRTPQSGDKGILIFNLKIVKPR